MPGLLRGVARVAVVAGTATAVSNRVSRRQAGRWAAQDQQQADQQQQAYEQQAPPPAAPNMDDQLDHMNARTNCLLRTWREGKNEMTKFSSFTPAQATQSDGANEDTFAL